MDINNTKKAGLSTNDIILIFCLVAGIILPFFLNSNYEFGIAHQALIFIILASGYNLLLGSTGILSLGHISLFAVGAYTSAILSVDLNWPFALSLLCATVLTSILGVLVAIPALRIKGHYLTLLTLALGESIRLIIRNLHGLTGGSNGFSGIERPNVFGFTFGTGPLLYSVLMLFAVVSVFVIRRLERSHYGRAFKAIRDSETGAEVSGVDTVRMKVTAFWLSAIFAGLAGGLYAHTMRFISPEFFSLGLTINLLAMVLIGGRGMIAGPVLGAILLTTAPESLRFMKEYYLILFGLGIWLSVLFLPQGVAGALQSLRVQLSKRSKN